MGADQRASDPREERTAALDEEYRRAITRIESLPENQPGSDKSWVWEALAQAEVHFGRARRR